MTSTPQLQLFDNGPVTGPLRSTQPTFVNNMALPIHRWYRFSAGYSATWAAHTIQQFLSSMDLTTATILDPFAGSGTTLLAASSTGSDSIGWEAQDLIYRIADAKLQSVYAETSALRAAARSIAEHTTTPRTAVRRQLTDEPDLLIRCYSEQSLLALRSLQTALIAERPTLSHSTWKLLWLALVSILRPASHAGTAQWQYIQPNKSKAHTLNVVDGFRAKVEQIAYDIDSTAGSLTGAMSLVLHDARISTPIPAHSIDLVLTSPPYANNYDYADATRLEMTFLGEVSSWSDLKPIREPLIHACSQHMAGYSTKAAIADPILSSIVDRLVPIYDQLAHVRLERGGRKAYHSMVVAYFHDMASVWINLRTLVRPGGRALFVVGDSAPYGVYIPVEVFLGDLAVAAGFGSYTFSKVRDRNIKWKNRKHRVPLKEGLLEVQG